MRFKILLRPSTRSLLIDWNYQQRLAAFIYNCLKKADPVYTKILHDGDRRVDKKPIKPFVFSWLKFPSGVRATPEGLIPNMGLAEFYIASPDLHFVQALVNGIHGEVLELGKETGYGVQTVELQPVPSFTDGRIIFRTMSPVVAPWVENPHEKGKLRQRKTFLEPKDLRFKQVLEKNLDRKYRLIYNRPLSSGVEVFIDPGYTDMKSKLVRFRGGAIRAYTLQVCLEAPSEVLNLAYQAGLGSYNSQGFGMIEVAG